MAQAVHIDDQPVSSTFFGEGDWLTDFITPDALEVEVLHQELTSGLSSLEDKIAACWEWVANQVRYKKFIPAKIWVGGKVSVQSDFWQKPSMCIRTRVGNCANKSFLLASLLRKELSPDQVHCILGNLHNGKPGGHAWVEAKLGSQNYIVEATRNDVALVPVEAAQRYEAVHYFNDQQSMAVLGRTVMQPFTACFSTWLKDYLDFAYIEGRK